MSKRKTHKEFLEDLELKNEHYKECKFKVVGEYVNTATKILVKDKYGEMLILPADLLNNTQPTIQSAVDKNSYIKNRFKEIHGNTYGYLHVDYKDMHTKIAIYCKKHKECFQQVAGSHLQGNGCPKCGGTLQSDTISFINRAVEIHGDKYGYHLTKYEKALKKVKIYCNTHKEYFKQTPSKHLSSGNGCPKCGIISSSKSASKNPTGWSLTNWKKAGLMSNNFDSFKVYIIKCWNDEEEFYKIGRTFNKVQHRFDHKKLMPYSWEVVQIIEGEPEYIFELESSLKRDNKEHRCTPKTEFKGMYECFSKINEVCLS